VRKAPLDIMGVLVSNLGERAGDGSKAMKYAALISVSK